MDYTTQVFTLEGQTAPQQAADSAQTVLRIETALAKGAMDRTARRDPKNLDHKMPEDQAVALAPNLDLKYYFTAVGSPSFTEMNVRNPEFFKQVNDLLDCRISGFAQDLCRLAPVCSKAARAGSRTAVRGCQLSLPAVLNRTKRESAPLEALRGTDRRRTGRSFRAESTSN